jgi:hypothetical protein
LRHCKPPVSAGEFLFSPAGSFCSGDQMSKINNFKKLDKKQLLSLAIYGEARGEAIEGKIAVASVIMNRIEKGEVVRR